MSRASAERAQRRFTARDNQIKGTAGAATLQAQADGLPAATIVLQVS
jgi:hypothetical protein